MEQKYLNFINHDWEKDENWKIYLMNLTPTPDKKTINKYRKKYYKLKIDADFDLNYEIGQLINEPHVHSNNCSHNHNNTFKNNETNKEPKKGLINSVFASIEGFLWTCIFFSLLVKSFEPNIAVIAALIRLFRTEPIDRNYELTRLLYNDCFQIAVFAAGLQFFHNDINYFVVFPITFTAFYNFCDYFANYLKLFSTIRGYFKKITKNKESFESLKSYSFILYIIAMPIVLLLQFNSFLFSVFYYSYFKFLIKYNENLKNSVNFILKSLQQKREKANSLFQAYYYIAIKYLELLS